MKKGISKLRFWLSTALLAVTVFAFALTATACTPDNTPSGEFLAAPEITANDDGIYWTKVEGATGYKIKLGDGEWSDVAADARVFAFPTSVGDYSLTVVATGEHEGKEVKFEFKVDKKTASAEKDGNAVVFTGDNIRYSVGENPETTPEDNRIDFSAGAVGSVYSVKYYSVGGWNNASKTFSINSDEQNISLTVTARLTAPVVSVNDSGTGIRWTADDNATGYKVTVDGNSVTATGNSVDFPLAPGAHTITVTATGGGAWLDSNAYTFEMTTADQNTPALTYESGNVIWDGDAAVEKKVGGDYEPIASGVNSVAASSVEGLRFASYYDDGSKTLYLPSVTVNFVERNQPELTFDKSGVINWTSNDSLPEETYKFSVDGGAAQTGNSVDVAALELTAGAHTVTVSAEHYLSTVSGEATLYIPAADTGVLGFTVLAAPELKIALGANNTYDSVAFDEIANATGYMFKSGDGQFAAVENANISGGRVTLSASSVSSAVLRFTVYAVGDNTQGNYAVNSPEASIVTDPSLTVSKYGVRKYLTFDSKDYESLMVDPTALNYSNANGTRDVVLTGEDADEAAILGGASGGAARITAGTGKATGGTGSSDGFKIELFEPISLASYRGTVYFRLFMTENPDRESNKGFIVNVIGHKNGEEQTSEILEWWPSVGEVGEWTTYALNLALSSFNSTDDITAFQIMFQKNGLAGDRLYVDEIYATTEDVRSDGTADFNADSDLIYAVSGGSLAIVTLDDGPFAGTDVLYASGVTGSGLDIKFKNVTLKQGDVITFVLRMNAGFTKEETDSHSHNYNCGVHLNHATQNYIREFSGSTDDWMAYTYTVGLTYNNVNLDYVHFRPYDPADSLFEFWIKAIYIEEPTKIQNNADGSFELDFEDMDHIPGGYISSQGTKASNKLDLSKRALYGDLDWSNSTYLCFNFENALSGKYQVEFVFKLGNGCKTAGGGFYIPNASGVTTFISGYDAADPSDWTTVSKNVNTSDHGATVFMVNNYQNGQGHNEIWVKSIKFTAVNG